MALLTDDRNRALYDASEYLIAGLENQAEWWEHLGDAHRDYAALARVAVEMDHALGQILDALSEARPYVFNRIDPPNKDWRSEIAQSVLERVDSALTAYETKGVF